MRYRPHPAFLLVALAIGSAVLAFASDWPMFFSVIAVLALLTAALTIYGTRGRRS